MNFSLLIIKTNYLTVVTAHTGFRLAAVAPDFTDTGDDDYRMSLQGDGDDDFDDDDLDEERRADLFAGLGPVAVFSARHRCTAPVWITVQPTVARSNRSMATGKEDDNDDGDKHADQLKMVLARYGFELRGGSMPPASIGHVRAESPAYVSCVNVMFVL